MCLYETSVADGQTLGFFRDKADPLARLMVDNPVVDVVISIGCVVKSATKQERDAGVGSPPSFSHIQDPPCLVRAPHRHRHIPHAVLPIVVDCLRSDSSRIDAGARTWPATPIEGPRKGRADQMHAPCAFPQVWI